jgi:autotransporter passenger strand-loop-strand repeat protein
MPNPAVAGAGLAVASAAIVAALATQTVSGGQVLNVENWTIDAVIVSSGGELNVLSSGTAYVATIDSGGSALVSAGGVVSGARVSAGGVLEIPVVRCREQRNGYAGGSPGGRVRRQRGRDDRLRHGGLAPRVWGGAQDRVPFMSLSRSTAAPSFPPAAPSTTRRCRAAAW